MWRHSWLAAVLLLTLGGCSTFAGNAALGVGGTIGLGHTPTSSISQVYYLGVFDPQDQLPPQVYRVRLRGQSSALNSTKFASGWVRAELVDSLSGAVEMPGETSTKEGEDSGASARIDRQKGLLTGRRLMLFGPEGFREAPRDHRLVVVMGSDPEAFFSAVDEALGVVASVTQGTNAGPSIEKALWADLSRTRLHAQKVDVVVDGLNNDYFPSN